MRMQTFPLSTCGLYSHREQEETNWLQRDSQISWVEAISGPKVATTRFGAWREELAKGTETMSNWADTVDTAGLAKAISEIKSNIFFSAPFPQTFAAKASAALLRVKTV